MNVRSTNMLLLVSTLAACSPGQSANNPSEDETNARFRTTALPERGDGFCEQKPTPPSVCDWASSVDLIAVGTISRVEAISDYFWVDDRRSGTTYPADSRPACADLAGGYVNVGVVIHVDVTDVLYGKLGSESLAVYAGASQVETWSSIPVEETRGDLSWLGSPVLSPGTTAGFPVVWYDDVQKWGLGGELPFSFQSDASTVFPPGGCNFVAPAPAPADFWSLESALANCATATNPTYDLRHSPDSFGRPSYAYASYAVCAEPVNSEPTPGPDAGR